MSESTPMVHLVEEYLDYRRRLGFQLHITGQMLLEFAQIDGRRQLCCRNSSPHGDRDRLTFERQ